MDENNDMIESKLIDQIKLDEILAFWRKNYADNYGIYKEGVPMPPPLYDDDLKHWTENKDSSCNLRKVDKDRLKNFYNADLLLEAIDAEEKARKRHEEIRKWYEEWRQSDDYKEMMKRLDNE